MQVQWTSYARLELRVSADGNKLALVNADLKVEFSIFFITRNSTTSQKALKLSTSRLWYPSLVAFRRRHKKRLLPIGGNFNVTIWPGERRRGYIKVRPSTWRDISIRALAHLLSCWSWSWSSWSSCLTRGTSSTA